ncbi:hypothetical protein [Streptomyces sp. NPDC047079]|uniref:hypothetical protein n=1 Tax=Streptomyces sp. NPDC047079 TaxID=3154607 RepID=UPI0033E2E1FB
MSVDVGTAGRFRPPVRPAVVLARTARLVALSLLVVSYVAWLFQEFPIPSAQEDLVKALRSGNPPAVEIGYDDNGVNLFWETAPLVYRELRVPGELGSDGVDAVEREIAAQAGERVEDLPFRNRQEQYEPGFLDTVLPASYPLFLRSAFLRWTAVSVGLAVLTAAYALPRGYQRVKNRGVWFSVCLVTGFGFFTFLWLEHCVAPDTGEPPELRPRYVWTASLATAVLMALGGWGLIRLMWWI